MPSVVDVRVYISARFLLGVHLLHEIGVPEEPADVVLGELTIGFIRSSISAC